jgi:hypothetical protein
MLALDVRFRPGRHFNRFVNVCFGNNGLEEPMDKPRIFLGSSGKQEKLLQALTRGLSDIANASNPG